MKKAITAILTISMLTGVMKAKPSKKKKCFSGWFPQWVWPSAEP